MSIGTAEAAKILGIKITTVGDYIRRGLLPAVRKDWKYSICEADLQNFVKHRRPRGRPKKNPC